MGFPIETGPAVALDEALMSAALSLGFVGTGVMGRGMASHLMAAGHAVHGFNRTKEKAQAQLDAGAHWHESAGHVAAASDVVITLLGFPQDVEETYLGAGGIGEKARLAAEIAGRGGPRKIVTF